MSVLLKLAYVQHLENASMYWEASDVFAQEVTKWIPLELTALIRMNAQMIRVAIQIV
jgi:hypothetical protein